MFFAFCLNSSIRFFFHRKSCILFDFRADFAFTLTAAWYNSIIFELALNMVTSYFTDFVRYVFDVTQTTICVTGLSCSVFSFFVLGFNTFPVVLSKNEQFCIKILFKVQKQLTLWHYIPIYLSLYVLINFFYNIMKSVL